MRKLLSLAVVLVLLPLAVAATTWEYTLNNFSGQTSVKQRTGFDWGLALMNDNLVFSFNEPGDLVTMKYYEDRRIAYIYGQMTEMNSGDKYTINYEMRRLQDFQDGQFAEVRGTGDGAVLGPSFSRSLGNAAMNGIYFSHLCDGHRLPNDTDTCVGRGWVGKKDIQDFLFEATRTSPIPVPAGVALLGSALVALGLWRRRV